MASIKIPPKKKKIHKGWAVFFIIFACLVIGVSIGLYMAYNNLGSQDLTSFMDALTATGGSIQLFIVSVIEWVQSESFNKSIPAIQSTVTIAASLLGIFVAIKTLKKK